MRVLGLLLAASVAAVACAPSPRGQARVEEGLSLSIPAALPSPAPLATVEPPKARESGSASEPSEPSLPAPRPEARRTLVAEGGHVVEVYPPLGEPTAALPLVVFLHATCMEPVDVCDFWSNAGREGSWLVCPAGPSTCYGAPDWSGTAKLKADTLDAAMAAVDGAYAPWVDKDRGDVLIGYSRGAFAARDILYDRPGRFRGLILLSAALSPDPARLKAAGIRRAVLATGDLDGSRPMMRRAAKALDDAGIPTRFVSLGKIGHWLPADLEAILRSAIAWVETPVS